MVALTIALVVMPLASIGIAFLLGFRLGGEHGLQEVTRTKLEAAEAERKLHDLTRQAFVAMAEHAERQRRQG